MDIREYSRDSLRCHTAMTAFESIIAANYTRDELAALRAWADELERLARISRK